MISGLFIGMSSCLVLVKDRPRHDNGNHWGWHKNPKNPHNPNHHNYDNSSNRGKKGQKDNNESGQSKKETPGKNKHRK